MAKLKPVITVDEEGGVHIESSLCFLASEMRDMDELADIDPIVWTNDKMDVVFIPCTPYKAKLKPNATPVFIKQYLLSLDKIAGITPLIEFFSDSGNTNSSDFSLQYTNQPGQEAGWVLPACTRSQSN